MLSVPSVATIDGTLSRVTITPLTMPRTSPIPIPSAIAAGASRTWRSRMLATQ